MKSWAELKFWNSKTWLDIQFYLGGVEYVPPREDWFKALALTPLKKTKVIILGQDPYHDGTATGLAFSCDKFTEDCPPTLRNIYKEYSSDLHLPVPKRGNLTAWARRGVLLLNTALTTAPHRANAHAGLAWNELTTEIVTEAYASNPNTVFICWGQNAKKLLEHLPNKKVVSSPHPSPLAAHKGFFGSRPFTKANGILVNTHQQPVNWKLP